MEINKQLLQPYLMFDDPIVYNEKLILHPVKMKDFLTFQKYQYAFTVRKDAVFRDKKIIKMTYLEFIKHACRNSELAEKYNMPLLPFYYDFIIAMLQIICGDDAEIKYRNDLSFSVNDFEISDEVFDDIRRIFFIQNNIDFDIDEFMNIETVQAFEKASEFEAKKKKEDSDIEDYIDSLIIELKISEEFVKNLTIRKFWRYIKRINKHEEYQICRTAGMSGWVSFKEPLQHWMTSIEVKDRYENLKTDEEELRSKIG